MNPDWIPTILGAVIFVIGTAILKDTIEASIKSNWNDAFHPIMLFFFWGPGVAMAVLGFCVCVSYFPKG